MKPDKPIYREIDLVDAVTREYGEVPRRIIVSRRDWNSLLNCLRRDDSRIKRDADGNAYLDLGATVIYGPPAANGVIDISNQDWVWQRDG